MAGFRNGKQTCIDNEKYQLIPQAPRSRACAGGVGQIRNPRCAIQNSKISSQSEPEPEDEWPPLGSILDKNSCEVMFSSPNSTTPPTNTIIDLKKWGEHEGGEFNRGAIDTGASIRTFFHARIDRAGLLALNPGFLESFDEAGAALILTGDTGKVGLGQLSFLFPPQVSYILFGKEDSLKLNMLDATQQYTVQPLVRCIWRLSHAGLPAKLFEPSFSVNAGVGGLHFGSWFPLLPYGDEVEHLGFRKINGDLDPVFEDGSTVTLGSHRFLTLNPRAIEVAIAQTGLDREGFSLKLEKMQIIFKSIITKP